MLGAANAVCGGEKTTAKTASNTLKPYVLFEKPHKGTNSSLVSYLMLFKILSKRQGPFFSW